MEQLLDNPFAVAVITAVIVFFMGRLVWRWRRESTLRHHASQQGWRPVDDTDGFADLVTREFPELRDEAEQDARAARRSGARRGRGPGVDVSLGSSGGVRSRTKARSVYVVPVDGGELAVGDVAVTGTSGTASQGRATARRGAVAARLSSPLPDVKLLSHSWIDRDSAGSLPERLRARFSNVELSDEARAAYLDSGAWETLLEAPEETDGIAVDDGHVVLLSGKQLTPERAEALAATARRFVAHAAAPGAERGGARLADPLAR